MEEIKMLHSKVKSLESVLDAKWASQSTVQGNPHTETEDESIIQMDLSKSDQPQEEIQDDHILD